MYRQSQKLIVGLAAAVLLAGAAFAQEGSDGPVLRSTTYRVRAQITDYTTGGSPGAIATITIRRASFAYSKSIVANRNEWVGVRTSYPGLTYAITCNYRGRSLTKYATATYPYRYVPFYYTQSGLQ